MSPKYFGRYPKLALYRIGKHDAAELLAEGWTLLQGQTAYEVVDPAGFARHWIARDAAKSLLAKQGE